MQYHRITKDSQGFYSVEDGYESGYDTHAEAEAVIWRILKEGHEDIGTGFAGDSIEASSFQATQGKANDRKFQNINNQGALPLARRKDKR